MDCLLQEPARVISQVEHQGCHALRMKLVQLCMQLVRGCVIKAMGHVDITHPGPNHVRVGNRRLRHCIARYLNGLGLSVAGPRHRYLHHCSAGSAYLVADFERTFAAHLDAIDFIDAVTKAQPGARGG